MGHFRSPPPLGLGATVCAAAILALSVSLVIPPVPRAFAQPGSGGVNQTKQGLPAAKMSPLPRSNTATRPQTIEGHRAQLLRYDVPLKLSASQSRRGFHNVKDLLPHSASTAPAFGNLSFDNHSIDKPGGRHGGSGVQRPRPWHFGEPLLARI